MTLTLEQADRIITAALAEGRNLNLAPLAVAVLDAGGNLVAFKREDGAGILRYDIAFGKAYGSLGMGFGTRELTKRAANQATFFAALGGFTGKALASPGGVLIADAQGRVLGAVGISGDIGDRDEDSAVAGIKAVGLVPVTGELPKPA